MHYNAFHACIKLLSDGGTEDYVQYLINHIKAWVLAPGSAHARPSAQPPIDTSGHFPAHISAESPSNISPNPSEVISEVSEP